ncbi:hypothetical protein [Nocardioides aurantiacus]|uniref:PD-(D/E)XK nuclease superfamily protein n=1 Tax=Nocardioides aurantiacus TaxID=86796 RepID=A0A3N2CTW8_9ACTN|nr:hypothetical protein [Nocardioides aurantiacus]ROR90980.1 hypothetical protein EDD33_1837 [Nocardioides aurantiacus]
MSAASKSRAAFAAAGLPVPIYKGPAPATVDHTVWDTRIGVLTHRVIGEVAPHAQNIPDVTGTVMADLVRSTVARVVADRTLGRLDRARIRVTGLTVQYVREYLPPLGVDFLGTELAAGGGRVDLAWYHPAVGVWFDELKTWRHARAGLDTETWVQVRRYLDAGKTTFGDAFVGVRLLTLGNRRACITITSNGLIEDLHTSPLAPARLHLRGVA